MQAEEPFDVVANGCRVVCPACAQSMDVSPLYYATCLDCPHCAADFVCAPTHKRPPLFSPLSADADRAREDASMLERLRLANTQLTEMVDVSNTKVAAFSAVNREQYDELTATNETVDALKKEVADLHANVETLASDRVHVVQKRFDLFRAEMTSQLHAYARADEQRQNAHLAANDDDDEVNEDVDMSVTELRTALRKSKRALKTLEAVNRHKTRLTSDARRAYMYLEPYIGVVFKRSPRWGIEVTELATGTSGELAGLCVGDIVEEINGVMVNSPSDFRRNLGTVRPGELLPLQVLRNHVIHTVVLVTGARNHTPDEVARVRRLAEAREDDYDAPVEQVRNAVSPSQML
jgi:hypothetical protein